MIKRLLLFCCLLMVTSLLHAQNKITGTVVDGTNEPIIGAVVKAEGSATGTVTDLDGHYSLDLPAGKTSITITSVGFKSQVINVRGRNEVNVTLVEDTKVMDEVVVVGYGTMKKSDLSGSLSSISGADVLKGGATDIAHGLQGKVAGVMVQQSDGAPGGGMSIVVRGANSFTTSSQPLYIVDGVPFSTGSTPTNSGTGSEQDSNPLSFINPHDIENIEILKDASATAIYGSRGANGVVIITTKKGKAGKPKVEFNASWGYQHITKKLDMLDPVTYAYYINEEYDNDRLYSGSQIKTVPYPGTWGYKNYADGHPNYNTGVYTGKPEDYAHSGWFYDEYGNATQLGNADWQDEIFEGAASQDYALSISGGSDTGHYSFSGGYTDQDGIIKNSGYKRYSLRSNISSKVFSWLELGTNTSFSNSTTDFANTLNYNTGVVRSALIFPPTYDPNMDTTQADDLNWLAANPAAYVKSTKDQLTAINWFSSNYVEITFFKQLKFRQNLGLGYNDSHRNAYYDRHTQEGKMPINGKASKAQNVWKSTTAESILTYDDTYSKVHHLNVMGAFTIENDSWNNNSETATGFPDDLTKDADMSKATGKPDITSDEGRQRLVSFLGRVNYSLQDKYLLTASVRTDGSSKFTSKNRWATFLSGALAWRASEEKFIKNLNVFSNLKFRVSYGETGNQGINAYSTLAHLVTSNYPFNGSTNSGYAQEVWRGLVDSDVKWETTAQWNAGIDFGFLQNALTFTVDYYHKKTRDLLQMVQIPSHNGFTTETTNSGNVTNEGLEFTLGWNVINTKDWQWSFNANASLNKNKIGGLDGDQYATSLWSGADQVFIQRNGCPIGAIYGYVEDGFYDNEAEIAAHPKLGAGGTNEIGEIRYRDLNGDGVITAEDRTIIGDTNPKCVYGLTNNLTWKNLTLSFMFQGSIGNDIFNGNLQDIKLGNIGNITRDAYDHRWTADNYENAQWPKATAGYTRTFLISDRYVKSGTYLKLKNISLVYNWRNPFAAIDNIRFSVAASNLFTITPYDWYDPDVNAFGSDSSRRGVDIYSYPASRTFTFGLGITF